MEDYYDKEKAKEFFREKTTEEIIKRYLITQAMKGTKDEAKYRGRIYTYEKVYECLDPELKEKHEARIRKEFEEGKIDVDKCLKQIGITKNDGEER